MTDNLELKQAFDLLDETLDTFGADSARWPAAARQRLLPLLAGNVQAQRRVAAARALDRVLNAAPRLSDARHAALLETIVHKAERQPRIVSQTAAERPSPLMRLRRHSMAAAALAASLMIGVLSGQNTTVGSLSEAMVTGGVSSSATGQQVAQSDDPKTFLDEDLL